MMMSTSDGDDLRERARRGDDAGRKAAVVAMA
jgi:hypothetical protein